METWITQLTPLSFLRRSADVYPDKCAVVHGDRRLTYRELAEQAERLASALREAGVRPGDRVAYLMPNVPEMLVAHFGVPLAGAVLVAINTRLAGEEIRYICDHSGAVMLVVDSAYAATVAPLAGTWKSVRTIVSHVDPDGPHADGGAAAIPGSIALTTLLDRAPTGDQEGGSARPVWAVDDERATISINYTSGTTGRPKGVMYSHRGAYLNALGEIQHSSHTPDSVYLWTLPMFHCNGWCTGWALVAVGGTQVCLREVRGEVIWELIDAHRVSHLNGAPTVLTTIMSAERARTLDHPLVVTTAGAPPSPSTIMRMERLGFSIVHVYGLTETYGPYSVCQWQSDWADLAPAERATRLSRQGVGMVQAERVRVVELGLTEDGELTDVPPDGETMGEIVMRGNNVMKGYYEDPEATAAAFAGGWFHSGDLGVMHPDGYIELRDRAKDVIVSGGENISTVEIEHALLAHDAVLEAAVIGVPDAKWGERPKAFVVARPGQAPTEDELLEHVRAHIARYKVPREIEFVDELPKTSTGKIQKFELREREWAGQASRIQG
ncbi:MAG TPA: long-chain-fatty-acid--CoA ligase [Pseudonocardia sp.]|jgi:fatty-acyl-CoA synthase